MRVPLAFGCFCLLLGLGAGLAGCSGRTDEEIAQTRCRARYDILWRWVSVNGRFPETDEELKDAGQDEERDPWGNPYLTERDGADFWVYSFGPDRQDGTNDDIYYPPLPD